MKDKKEFICRLVFHSLLFLTLACVITASCLLAYYPVVGYCLYGAAGAALVAQLLTALFVTVIKGKTPINGFEQWATALMVFGIILTLIVLSPIIAVLLIADAIRQSRLSHNTQL